MMVQDKEELELSLSLSFPASDDNQKNNQTAQVSSSLSPLNLIPSSTFNLLHNTTWNQQSASDRNIGTCRPERRPSLTGINVNRLPAAATAATAEMEEQPVVSSPNSSLSSLSGNKRNLIIERSEQTNGEDLPECSRSDEEEGEHSRKKLRLSKEQATILEENFKEHNTLNTRQKVALAKRLGLRPRQVEVWFQNRRARTKLKQTEVDCEVLRRCCETLTEQNRKLQKEVQELKTLKLSPQFYMQMAPPTTLTMCPSCERVAVPPSTTAVSIGLSMTPTEPPQPHQMSANVHRSPFNPWASKPVATRPLDVLRPQS